MTIEEMYAKYGWDYSRLMGTMLSESTTQKLIVEAAEHFGSYFPEVRKLLIAKNFSEAKTILNDILATCDFLGITPISSKIELLKQIILTEGASDRVMPAFDSAYQQYEIMQANILKS